MKRGSHISFADWEPGEPVDEGHLADCPTCQRRWALMRFLRVQAKAAPEIEPPPFFTARVSKLAQSAAVPFWGLLERAARQLMPVFVVLAMASTLVLYNYQGAEGVMDEHAVLLMEPAEVTELTLDDIILSLREPLEENIAEDQ